MSHISRMCWSMSCGMPSAGRGMSGLSSVGRQPCSRPALPAWSIRCSTSRTRGQVLVEPPLVGRADVLAQAAGLFQHGVEHALVGPADVVAEQAVEGQGRVQLQRRRRGGRTPRDVRAVDHRVVLVDGRDRRLAAEHQARHLGLVLQPLGDDLVAADAGADLAAGGQVRAGEQVAGLAAVDAADQGLRRCTARGGTGASRGTAAAARAPCPAPSLRLRPWPTTPWLWKPLPENRQANRTGGSDALPLRLVVAPDRDRFEPRQGHGHAERRGGRSGGRGGRTLRSVMGPVSHCRPRDRVRRPHAHRISSCEATPQSFVGPVEETPIARDECTRDEVASRVRGHLRKRHSDQGGRSAPRGVPSSSTTETGAYEIDGTTWFRQTRRAP